jgi:hypothetical protein
MLPFGVTIPAAVPQGSEIPEGLVNNPLYQQLDNISKFWQHVSAVKSHHQAKISLL